MRGARFRGLLCSALLVASGAPAVVHANDRRELLEPDFLDLVDQAGLVLITGQGAVGVDAKARRLGLQVPALGYWSPEGFCFSTPAQGDCHAMFRR